MNISIQFVKMPTSDALAHYVTRKLRKIEEKYGWIIHAEVFFKMEYHPGGKGMVCEMELSVPGPRIFAVSDEFNYQRSVKETLSKLKKQLKKRKAILIAQE
jgi:ribosomal subunit interface protein